MPYLVSPRGKLVSELICRESPFQKRAWIALVERSNLAHANLIQFISRIEAEDAAMLGLSIRELRVAPNGVDTPGDDRAAAEEGSFLLFIRQINSKKGLERLIAALPLDSKRRLIVAVNDEEGLKPGLVEQAGKAGVGIQRLISDPVALKAMGQSGREFVRHRYSWETVGRQTEEANRQAAGGRIPTLPRP